MSELPRIVIPDGLLPADGRFGCGPSKIRPEQLAALAAALPALEQIADATPPDARNR
jgi:hypothetical protein